MMGLGGIGTSSSSSNLSALAPPFTVSKLNSNPLVDLSESPYPATHLNPAVHNWLYSQDPSSRPDFLANPEPERDSAHLPSYTAYGVPASSHIPTKFPTSNPAHAPQSATFSFAQCSESQFTHLPTSLPPINSISSPRRDTYAHARCSDSLVTSVVQTKPYYPQYNPPAVHESSPLVTLAESGYDSSASSGCYPDEYAQNMAGLEYLRQWNGLWNGLGDANGSSKPVGFDQSIGPIRSNIPVSSYYANFPLEGGTKAATLSRWEEAPTVYDRKCINVQGRSSCSGPLTAEQSYEKSISRPYITTESTRTSVIGASVTIPDCPSDASSSEPFSYPFNHHVLHVKSSPAVVIRPPTPGSSSSTAKALPFENKKFGINANGDHDKEFAGYIPSDSKEPRYEPDHGRHEVFPDESRLSIKVRKIEPIVFKEKEISSKSYVPDNLNQASRTKFEPKVSHVNGSDNTHLSISATTSLSAEKLSDSLDSPCWKGPPSSRLLPFEDTQQFLMKQLESSNDSSLLQAPLCFDGAIKLSTLKFDEGHRHCEDSFVPNCSPHLLKKLNIDVQSTLEGPEQIAEAALSNKDVTIAIRTQIPDYIYEPRPDHVRDNLKPNSGFRSQWIQPGPEEVNSVSVKVITGNDYVDDSECINNASEGHHVHIPPAMSPSCLPCSQEDVSVKLSKQQEGRLAPQINVQLFIDAIYNLSELILSSCLAEPYSLKQHNHEVLNHVINNLERCLLRNAEEKSAQDESSNGASNLLGHLPNLGKAVSVGRHLMCNELRAGVEDHHLPEEMNLQSSVKDESLPLRDTRSLRKDDGMRKVLKRILIENFENGEENSQALLYKNLWLEAEAALCSINYKARFDRVKSEMQNHRFQKAKDGSANVVAAKNLTSSKVTPETSTLIKLESVVNDTLAHCNSREDSPSKTSRFQKSKGNVVAGETSLNSKDSHEARPPGISAFEESGVPIKEFPIQDSRNESRSGHLNDVDASVMARFHILKSRGENSNRIDTAKPLLPEVLSDGFTDYTEDKQGMPMHGFEHETVKEFRICATDESASQCRATNRLGKQLPPGWYDSGSSEWEHVLKEELQWRE